MKYILLSLVFSFSALANVNLLVGKYQGKTADDTATVRKVMIKPADLFEPAKYEYRLDFENNDLQLGFDNKLLEISTDGKFLSRNTDQECDDPGCRYFTSIDISISKKGSAAPVMELYIDGFDYADDSASDETPFQKTLKYKKVK